MIKEERRKARRRKKLLIGLAVTVLVLAGAALAVLELFQVKNVEIKGNKLYGADIIESAILSDDYSWNSLYVFLKYRFVKTKEIPFIKRVPTQLWSYALALVTLLVTAAFGTGLTPQGAVLALINAALVSLSSNGGYAAVSRLKTGLVESAAREE